MTSKEIISRYYDCFNRKDKDVVLALLDEYVIHNINQGASEAGKKMFADFIKHATQCYHETTQDLVIMVSEDGKRAAAEYIMVGSYVASDEGLPEAKGQKYELAGGGFFTLKNNKITRVTAYYNLNDWLQQIREPA
jgi:steroid delta-isomerase-like uncharacterized protein